MMLHEDHTLVKLLHNNVMEIPTTPTLPLLKCVVLAEVEIREFARTRTTEPRTVSDNLVLMWPFHTITEI